MTVEIPEELEGVLRVQADALGMSPEIYVRSVLKLDLAGVIASGEPRRPLKSGFGMWAKYDFDLSAEDIDENRKDMFKGFGESF